MVNQDEHVQLRVRTPLPAALTSRSWLTGQGLVNTTLARWHSNPRPVPSTSHAPGERELGGVAVPRREHRFRGLVYTGKVQINLLIPANASDRECGPAGSYDRRGVFPG